MEVLRWRGGALMHACGVIDGSGQGLLFCGRSGAGKTTTARLWAAAGAKVLNDDRTVVRADLTRLSIFGTPWHGELGSVTNAAAPLRALFLLRKADRCALTPLRPGEVARRLLGCSWPPIWANKGGLDLLVPLFRRLAREVPAYELAFTPDRAAVELVREALARPR